MGIWDVFLSMCWERVRRVVALEKKVRVCEQCKKGPGVGSLLATQG